MNGRRIATYLSGALLVCAVAVAFAPIIIVIVVEFGNLRDWLKTGVRPSVLFADWYRIKLPHTAWVGLQRILDSLNGAPGPIILLAVCTCTAILLFFLSRLVAGPARDPGGLR